MGRQEFIKTLYFVEIRENRQIFTPIRENKSALSFSPSVFTETFSEEFVGSLKKFQKQFSPHRYGKSYWLAIRSCS